MKDDIQFIDDDPVLSGKINRYMRARFDLEEVKNDPMVDKIRSETGRMISDYRQNCENENFIRNAFSEIATDLRVENEINEIKFVSGKSNINDLSAEWVEEWHRKKQMNNVPTKADQERKSFISANIIQEEIASTPVLPLHKNTKKRSLYIRYISLSAAAVIGAMILINGLMPSSDPDKIFSSYYQPFNALSPITRGENNNSIAIYASAIKDYKSGNYEKAAAGFSKMTASDPSFNSTFFYLGLTDLATGNFEKAIGRFSEELKQKGEFYKESQWYLGLAYLKTGNNLKATECFEYLSGSKGFYSERSEKILRLLKK
jgi:tetratricopeptide (TPR) repeat protein